MLLRKIIALVVITIMILACNLTSLPTPPVSPPVSIPSIVIPTVIIPTLNIPTISLNSPVSIPEPVFTDVPLISEKDESILIESPTPGAGFTGWMPVSGESDPTFEQTLVLRLVNAEGENIFQTNAQILAEAGKRGPFSLDMVLPQAPAQPALLQIYSLSPKDGSLVHLSSVGIVLNSTGNESGAISKVEKISIDSVKQEKNGSDSILTVSGSAYGLFENTLNYSVCGETTGNGVDFICGSKENHLVDGVITTSASEMGQVGDYSITIPKSVPLPPSATIVVYSTSSMNGAVEHAASHSLAPTE